MIGSNRSIRTSRSEPLCWTTGTASTPLSMTLDFTTLRHWPVLAWHIKTNIQLGDEKCTTGECVLGMYEAFPSRCVHGHLQADRYACVLPLYNVSRCSSISGTGISVNNVRGILSTKIPHKPAVTTTPKYRYSLNQVSNPRYQTEVKPQPWFKPQL